MKTTITGIIAFILLLTGTSYAQYFVHKNQYKAVWGSTGYSFCNHSLDKINTIGNTGITIGAGIEWKTYKHYYFLTGLELNYLSSKTSISNFTDSRQLIDTDNSTYNEFTLNSSFSNCSEKNNFIYLNIPLMHGLVFKKMYLSGGAKLGASVYSNYVTRTHLTTTGDYEWFINDFSNMPNHFFVENERIRDVNYISTSFSIILSAEIGRYWINKINSELRVLKLAAFIDYGVLNMMSRVENTEFYLRYNENPIDYQFSSVYGIAHASDGSVNSIFTGLKVTYLINHRKGWFCKEKDGLCF